MNLNCKFNSQNHFNPIKSIQNVNSFNDESLQIRYQQKQKEEMDRKRNEFISSRAAISPLDFNENNRIHIGNGKVNVCMLFNKYQRKKMEIKNKNNH